MSFISSDLIAELRIKLENHPIYKGIDNIQKLRIFMEHHVFSVWDFMSLIKYLQHHIAPTQVPWVPTGDASVRRFINELVLEEESDVAFGENEYSSHFELYLGAMREINADTSRITFFIDTLKEHGLERALNLEIIPEPSRTFMGETFSLIREDQPHKVAAALALGREHIIPFIFRAILSQIGINDKQAPIFHYYLNRHIGLDEDFHGPLSLKLTELLCKDQPEKILEVKETARSVVSARIQFWDGVHEVLKSESLHSISI